MAFDHPQPGGTPDVRPRSLKGVLRIGRVPRRELDLGVEPGPAPDDRELPAPGCVGLFRLGQVRHLDTGKAQQVAEGSGGERLVDLVLDLPERSPHVVEVDVLRSTAAVVEQTHVRAALHDVFCDGQVRWQDLEKRQLEELDELGARLRCVHAARLRDIDTSRQYVVLLSDIVLSGPVYETRERSG